ncbi:MULTISPECIES: class I SAM-dependent methyltransferase [Haloferax]|uniref:Methyltransferase domain-containing protein n=1 Tax=Haloferax marinum TaxID=2666143 RepID=A0A6A8GAE3_9EURY|nr:MULTISPECIES: class I SAM-dependent methyltransferase [Haloferax]KAB1197990.1 class I SAM-dependent methyltransferase [Haloferax sp. CBA1150]MRW97056.1 methyltransferase domain-containing protein [Haloferax marinum]
MTEQRRTVRDGYDTLAEEYLDRRNDDPEWVLSELTDRLEPGDSVLDAGCGQGVPVTNTLTVDFDTVGLDFSRSQLRLARTNVSGARFVQGDMTALPFEDDSFDAICAFYSLIHIPTDEHEQVISEFARVLRPGNYLLATVGDDAWEGSNPDWLGTDVEMQWSFPSIEETFETLNRVGFEVVEQFVVDDELGSDHPFVLAQYDPD